MFIIFTTELQMSYQYYCCAKRDGFVRMILTNREEKQNNDEYPKASFAPIKVIKFGGISAGMEH